MDAFKQIVATMAVFASALFAHGANVGSVETKMGTLAVDGSNYTASSLEYKASPSSGSAPYRTQTGWYAGIQLNWDSQKQNAKETKASVLDSPTNLNKVNEYTVYNNGDKTPSGSGMKNATTTSGNILNRKCWISTTEWYIYVTPEFMYSLNGEDYSATLTIGGNTYTITVPHDIILSDGSHQRYPVVGLLGDELYGEAQYLADQITLDNYTTVKSLSDPSEAGFTFEVKIDDGNIEAARVQAASIIQTATSLGGDGGFSSLAAHRISFDGNKITIIKDQNFDREFFKIVIKKDGDSAE